MRTLRITQDVWCAILSKCVWSKCASILLCVGSLHLFGGRAVGPPPPAQVRPAQVPSIKTDHRKYEPLGLPPLPRAGGKLNDPVFGTEIMRVTDAESAPKGAGTSYSYWSSFNADNTKLLVMDAAASLYGTIYNFDPETFTLGARLPPVPYLPPGNIAVRLDDACWSHTDPDALYVHQDTGTKIYKYTVSKRTYTLVGDVARALPRGQNVQQMSMASDNDTFAFTKRGDGPDYKFLGYAVYRASTNKILFQDSEAIDEVRIDKSGRYLLVATNEAGVGKHEVRIVDVETGSVENLRDDGPDHAPMHYDVGTGTAVGNGNFLVGISARHLSTPHSFKKILDLDGQRNYGGFHISMLADNEDWALVSFYTEHINGVMQSEVVQVAMDGSGRVRRLFHHRSVFDSYYDTPRANISRDGRYVAFSSNWGVKGGRHDMFIARIPAAPAAGDPVPTPTPTVSGDAVWFEGAVPAGATPAADADVWDWVTDNPASFSGRPAHRSSVHPGFHQHHFANAGHTMQLGAGDKIFTYIYLDPNNLPNQVMLQWHVRGEDVEGWEHRAYWGASYVNWGVEGTNSRRHMGPLPAAGQWVRLEVSASEVGLEGKTLDGMAFTLHGGRASWDRTGRKTLAAATPTPTPTATPTPTPTPTNSLSAPALVAAARTLATTLGGAQSVSAAEINVLENHIEAAYAAYVREASQFTASAAIDASLRVSLYFARAAEALAAAGASSSSVQNRLQITASRLAQANNLMLPPVGGSVAGGNAHAPAAAAATSLPFIGAANTFSSASIAPLLSPRSLGTITGDAAQSPLARSGVVADTSGNKTLPYELEGASVSINGRA
ncbi:MAG TPA: hypothetical protein VF634_12165, partial [Pyrinomonadaceae bacterium]